MERIVFVLARWWGWCFTDFAWLLYVDLLHRVEPNAMLYLENRNYDVNLDHGDEQMSKHEIGTYLVIDPEICHGQMTFKGTRLPVDTVLTFLAKGYTIDQLLHSWPELSRSAIEEALQLASTSLQERYQLSQPAVAEFA